MIEKGYKNVFALKGGLYVWKNAGYAIEVGSIDEPVQIDLNDASNSSDGTVSINVTLNANEKPVSIISLEIGFEPDLLTRPEAVISPTIEPGTPTDRMLSISNPTADILRLDFLPAQHSQASLDAVIPDGIIATVIFYIAPDAKSGTKINLTNTPDAMDSKERFFRTTGRNATVTISSSVSVKRSLKLATTWGSIKYR